jgi:hypothetical protein
VSAVWSLEFEAWRLADTDKKGGVFSISMPILILMSYFRCGSRFPTPPGPWQFLASSMFPGKQGAMGVNGTSGFHCGGEPGKGRAVFLI